MFKCPLCDATFTRDYSRKLHYRKHSGESPYECIVCHIKFQRKDKRDKHEEEMHRESLEFPCDDCSEVFSSRLNLKNHKKTHVVVPKCDICGKIFTKNAFLNRHKIIHDPDKRRTCNICAKVFTCDYELNNHIKRHSGEKNYSCDRCGKYFGYEQTLKIHMEKVHTEEKTYECSECGINFCEEFELRKHRKTHFVEKSFECDICCSAAFYTKANLEMHKRSHTGVRPYLCKGCGKKFTTASSLWRHRKRHCHGLDNNVNLPDDDLKNMNTAVGKYKCDVCCITFNYRHNLEHHLTAHETGRIPNKQDLNTEVDCKSKTIKNNSSSEIRMPEKSLLVINCTNKDATKSVILKNLKCKVHKKIFNRNCSLEKNHQKRSKYKFFKCNLCSKRFSTKYYLSIHKKLHTGVKLHACDMCGKDFTFETVWKNHKKIHTNKKL